LQDVDVRLELGRVCLQGGPERLKEGDFRLIQRSLFLAMLRCVDLLLSLLYQVIDREGLVFVANPIFARWCSATSSATALTVDSNPRKYDRKDFSKKVLTCCRRSLCPRSSGRSSLPLATEMTQ
jgi:hypothetical protein